MLVVAIFATSEVELKVYLRFPVAYSTRLSLRGGNILLLAVINFTFSRQLFTSVKALIDKNTCTGKISWKGRLDVCTDTPSVIERSGKTPFGRVSKRFRSWI